MNETNSAPTEQKTDNKEYNFRALEAKYKRDLEQERAIRLETERRLQELSQPKHVDDDDDDEPYVDKKRLRREQEKFGNQIKQDTQSEIQRAVKTALYEKEREDWLNQNPDFYETMNHVEKLAIEHPDLAKTILKLPDNFERQQLVYQNIKKLGLNKERPDLLAGMICSEDSSLEKRTFSVTSGKNTADCKDSLYSYKTILN
jgi:hypothetical protein